MSWWIDFKLTWETRKEFNKMLTAQKSILLLDEADTVLHLISPTKQSCSSLMSVFYFVKNQIYPPETQI